MLVIEWSIAKLDIHVQVYISENLPSLFFKMSMIEGIDLTQICSIFYNILWRRSRTCQTRKRVRRKMMKGDFTDEFLEDEDVEEDDNDNEEL